MTGRGAAWLLAVCLAACCAVGALGQPVGPAVPAQVQAAMVAIVIDDIESLDQLRPFLEVPLTISFAVLPTSPGATAVAAHLSVTHREYLVHLPMEPVEADHVTGPGFLNTAMDEAVIQAVLARHIEAVPGARGANNHMGSKFTTDGPRMDAVMRFLARREMFFVDSRTAAATVGRASAERAGVPVAERDVFLDNDSNEAAVLARLIELALVARERGCAVGIGHPRPGTAAALARLAREPALIGPGVPLEFVPVARLIASGCRRPAPPEPASAPLPGPAATPVPGTGPGAPAQPGRLRHRRLPRRRPPATAAYPS